MNKFYNKMFLTTFFKYNKQFGEYLCSGHRYLKAGKSCLYLCYDPLGVHTYYLFKGIGSNMNYHFSMYIDGECMGYNEFTVDDIKNLFEIGYKFI